MSRLYHRATPTTSGDPECAPGQALFGTEEPHGLFAVLELSFYTTDNPPGQYTPRDHRGELVVFSPTDDMTGVSVPYHAQLEGNDQMIFETEGCGGFSFVLPSYQETWVWIENVYVTETWDLCLATTGTMRVEYIA